LEDVPLEESTYPSALASSDPELLEDVPASPEPLDELLPDPDPPDAASEPLASGVDETVPLPQAAEKDITATGIESLRIIS
jgi:hypothetical protein